MYYESVFRKLNDYRVRYVVAGGIAVVLHGVVRLTVDLDLIVDLEDMNLQRFIKAMEDLGYRPKVPVKAKEFANAAKREEWIREKGMKVFTFYHPAKQGELVDVFVKEPLPFSDLRSDRKVIKADDVRIPIVSIKHLKKLKMLAGRPQDLADVKSLTNLEEMLRGEA